MEKNLAKYFICENCLYATFSIIFVIKPENKLQFYKNYWGFNTIFIEN